MPRRTTSPTTSITSSCRGMGTLSYSSLVSKGSIGASLGILTSDHEVVRLITRRLPSEFYDVEQRTIFLPPGITRSEMKEIARASYVNRKTKASEEWKLAAVVSAAAAPSVESHALAVGGGFHDNSGG